MNDVIIKKEESIVENKNFDAFQKGLELEDLKITKIEYKIDGVKNYNEKLKAKKLKEKLKEEHYEIHVVLKEGKEIKCNKCGSNNVCEKDKELKYYELDKMMGKPAWIVYRRKQYRCGHCGSNVYGECNDMYNKRKYTANLLLGIMDKLAHARSRASIARECEVSETLVKEVNDMLPEEMPQLGEILCMDEFKGNLDNPESEWKDKYQTLLVNGKTGRIIDILPTRQYADLERYFASISEEEREKVKYCISDMSPIFIGIYKKYFPKAKIIIDRFHYTRLMVEAFEDIRKSLQDNPVYKKLGIKKMYKVLLKKAEELKDDKYKKANERLAEIFKKCPQIKEAYDILQEFYEFNKSRDREVARIKIKRLKEKIEKLKGYESFKKAMRSIENKIKYILNSFTIRETNAYAEGNNNFIKVLKRVSYGCKNLLRFKKRIMYIQSCYQEYKEKRLKYKLS